MNSWTIETLFIFYGTLIFCSLYFKTGIFYIFIEDLIKAGQKILGARKEL